MRVAVFTPSYRGHFEIFRLLCESMDRYVDEAIDHVVVVPARDLPIFKPFESRRRHIMAQEDILPRTLVRVPGASAVFPRELYLNLPWRPVRGWVVQQLLKLSANQATDADVVVLADSDTCFVRPVSPRTFLRGKRVRFYRQPGEGHLESHYSWHQSSARLLGLPGTRYSGTHYIASLPIWRTADLGCLQAHIERVNSRSWHSALCQEWQVSENILFGMFVDHVMGRREMVYAPMDRSLTHSSWDYDLSSETGRSVFVSDFDETHHVAFDVQKHRKLPVSVNHGLYAELSTRPMHLQAA